MAIHNTTPLLRVLILRTFLYSSSYGSFKLPILFSSSFNPFKYFLSFSILCWSFLFSSSFITPSLYPLLSSSTFFRSRFLLYLENRFLFHCLQFSFIHFQYSLSYLLFSHPYISFAIYLHSNFLLNISLSSLFSCHLTSSSSLSYSLLNLFTRSIAFFKFFLLSQISSLAMHPFHCT